MWHLNEGGHMTRKHNGGGQQPKNGKRKDNSKHTPTSGKGGALKSSLVGCTYQTIQGCVTALMAANTERNFTYHGRKY